MFGDEETQLIVPAIETARNEGIDASGPHSADTLFWFAAQGRYDAVICMYHDQGLIPLKLLHFDDGVNVTLGLPIVRTSVDHGTAYDLAGSGKASPTSLIAAVKMADEMADKTGTRCEVARCEENHKLKQSLWFFALRGSRLNLPAKRIILLTAKILQKKTHGR